jgi:ABC-type polysaccharide/polyol phosphate transport system ATPase subunit
VYTSTTQNDPPAVEIEALGFTYPSGGIGEPGVEALRDITMRVDQGARLGILGPRHAKRGSLATCRSASARIWTGR